MSKIDNSQCNKKLSKIKIKLIREIKATFNEKNVGKTLHKKDVLIKKIYPGIEKGKCEEMMLTLELMDMLRDNEDNLNDYLARRAN